MADREDTAVQRVTGHDYLLPYADDDKSVDSLGQYRVLSRVKIVQGTSKPELKEDFGEGSVLITPGNALVAAQGSGFLFVPL